MTRIEFTRQTTPLPAAPAEQNQITEYVRSLGGPDQRAARVTWDGDKYQWGYEWTAPWGRIFMQGGYCSAAHAKSACDLGVASVPGGAYSLHGWIAVQPIAGGADTARQTTPLPAASATEAVFTIMATTSKRPTFFIKCQNHCRMDGCLKMCSEGAPRTGGHFQTKGGAEKRVKKLLWAAAPPRIAGAANQSPLKHLASIPGGKTPACYREVVPGTVQIMTTGVTCPVCKVSTEYRSRLRRDARARGAANPPRIRGGADDHPDAPSDEATFTIHGVTRHWEEMPCQYGFGIRCQNHCLPEVISPVGGCDKAKSFYRRYEDAQRDTDAFAAEYNFPPRIAGGADIPDSVLDFVRTQITAEPDSWLPETDALAAYRAHVGRKRIKANERDGIAPALLSGYGVKYLAIFPDGEEQLGFRGVGLRTAVVEPQAALPLPEPPQREPDAPTQAPTVGRSHAHPPIPGREPLDHTNLDHDHAPPEGGQARVLDYAEQSPAAIAFANTRLAKAGKGHKESWAAVRHTYYDTLDHKQTQRDDDALMFAIQFVYRHAFWDFSNKDVYGVKMAEAAAPMITPEESRVAAEAMAEKGIAEQAAKRAKRRASRAEAETARVHAAFPSCKQCGSGSQTIDEDGACRDRRSCDARRMARSQTDADAARERVKVKRAKRMRDAVSESTPGEGDDGPGSFPAVSIEQRDSMARWLIAITEPKSGEWTAWESIYRAYGWNEWNGAGDGKKMYPNINERNALSDALRGIYPTAAWTKHSGIGGIDNMKLLDAPVWPDPVPADKRDHISEPRKPLPQPEAETLEPIRLVRFKCVKCGSESQSREVCFTSEELTSEVENLRVAHNAIMHPPAPITTPFTTESDIPLPTFDPPARTLPDNVRDAVDQHPDVARFVVNGLEKSPDGGAVPCKALRACMDKYLGRARNLEDVVALEAIAGFQYGMTYENRFGSEVFANVQIVSVVAEPSVTHYQHQSGDALCGTDTRDVDGWAEDESATCKECLSMLGSFPDSDAPSPASDPDLIDRYIAAVEYRKRLEDELDQAKQQTAEFEEPLRQLFIETGTQSVNRRGWSVHMRRDLWARVLGEDRDKAYAALRALPEWQHLVTETVNAQSLKSTVRSLQESRGLAKGASDEELAEGILPASLRAHIGLGRQTTIRATRSRKES